MIYNATPSITLSFCRDTHLAVWVLPSYLTKSCALTDGLTISLDLHKSKIYFHATLLQDNGAFPDDARPGCSGKQFCISMQYGVHEGTSQSAAYAAGAAALLLSAFREAGLQGKGSGVKDMILEGAARSAGLQNKCKSGAYST